MNFILLQVFSMQLFVGSMWKKQELSCMKGESLNFFPM